jgi:hypothetical protein
LRLAALALALAANLAVCSVEAQTTCQHSPLLAGRCLWVHGRLSPWNGSPSYRIWQVGTHHVMGVHDADNAHEFMYPLPPAVRAATPAGADPAKTAIWGDFLLCPFTKARPGWMQYVCVAQTAHLSASPITR